MNTRLQFWKSAAGILVFIVSTIIVISVTYRYTDSNLVVGILGFAGAIAVAAYQYRTVKYKEAEARLFSEKQAIYTDLVDTIMGLFHSQRHYAKKTDPDVLTRKLHSIRSKLIVWGSFETIHAFDRLAAYSEHESSDALTAGLHRLAALFAAIRRDLGHKDPENAGREIALGMLKPEDGKLARAKM